MLWADEIVVADSNSTDATASLAAALGARIVQVPFAGFGALRNSAVEACRHEWIFSLDADERCTAAVRDEILGIIAANDAGHDAYLVPRRSYMMGRWIKGSGWYPNYRQPQLFRKAAMRYRADPVHEGYELLTARPPGRLRHAIEQYPFRDLDEIIRKMNRYSSLGAGKLSRPVSMWSALGHGIWAFLKHYIAKRGFKDGWAGFVIALGNFEGTFYRYAKRYEQDRSWGPPPSEKLERPTVNPPSP